MKIRLAVLPLCIGLFGSSASSATAKPTGRVVMRDNISRVHRDELVSKLRKITGWPKLNFTTEGVLSLDTQDTLKGSKGARILLSKAVAGEHVIVLEDASARADVAFCRVVPGRWRTPHALTPNAYVVLIDFSDFDQIIGDEAARESFDAGWALLHELDHVVMDSEDTAINGRW